MTRFEVRPAQNMHRKGYAVWDTRDECWASRYVETRRKDCERHCAELETYWAGIDRLIEQKRAEEEAARAERLARRIAKRAAQLRVAELAARQMTFAF